MYKWIHSIRWLEINITWCGWEFVYVLSGWIRRRENKKAFLPPVNEVCEGYVFTGVCLSTGGWCLPLVPGGCLQHPPDRHPPPQRILRDTVNKRAVRIPLECILVVECHTVRFPTARASLRTNLNMGGGGVRVRVVGRLHSELQVEQLWTCLGLGGGTRARALYSGTPSPPMEGMTIRWTDTTENITFAAQIAGGNNPE